MIIFSDDKTRLQIDRVHAWLASSYWSPDIARAQVEKAIAGSHCLGVYRDGVQVGFARMITDHASFAWLDDVWVEAENRGEGLARRMVQWFIDHPDFQGIRRMMLVTRDAHGVYEGVGFQPLIRPERFMERLTPEIANLLRASQ
ncbi:MAG: GNAT family N-acetyltransferase [Pseudomonadota bacterium]